ncbi:recombinase family protein [Streptomyces guryensis]|uniref:Recombinase family protein n=1 Tax=Streptomyces guryensis TaxID=2886947 RepID=A0A9Q3VZ53_9ACTN|nr:recombinase family protein [Streptomyces guryensis]MCD9880220.1 recombinase family protein [Streptomyces guryensis]
MLHPLTLGADLRERGIGLHVIEQGIDTSTMEGTAMFGMLSVLAELLMLTEIPRRARPPDPPPRPSSAPTVSRASTPNCGVWGGG